MTKIVPIAQPLISGVVEDFDDAVGLGTVAAEGRRWPFHCTQIADGSRVIAPGAEVTFQVVAGHRGRWEAAGLRPVFRGP